MAETKTLVLDDAATNPFRIKPPEGQMLAIVKGNKDGELYRIIESITGWHFRYQEFDPNPDYFPGPEVDKWELLPDFKAKRRIYTPPQKGMLEAEFGIINAGFGKALFIPHTHYTKWELKPGSTKPELVEKERTEGPFFFFQYNLAIPIVEVETAGNLKVTVYMNLVVRLRNPYKAQFLAGGWENLLNARVQGVVTGYLRPLHIRDVGQEAVSAEVDKRIMKLNGARNGFLKKFGVEVHDVSFVGFKIEGDKRIQDALTEVEVTALDLEAADNEAKRIERLGQANATVAGLLVTQYGREGAAQVRAAELQKEALTGTQASVVSIGAPMPIAVTPKTP